LGGWIKLHRRLLDKPIWTCSTPEQKVILITILLLANHKEKQWEWKGKQFICRPGQFITSSTSLAKAAGVTRQNVRTALKRFEKYEFLTYESTNAGILINVVNWAIYQDDDKQPNQEANQGVTNDQPRGNQRLTTTKNIKNDKNDKERINAFFEECWNMYPLKKGKGKISDTQKKKLYKLGDELKRCITRYLAFVDSERKRGFNLAYKNGSTFFNSGYIDYLDEVYEKNHPPPANPKPLGKIVEIPSDYTGTLREIEEQRKQTEFDW
jgi:hypothetical protein